MRWTNRAVLFDVGGPINTEVAHERGWDAGILAGFTEAGRAVSAERYAAAWRWAVAAFAPNAYAAVIWTLAGGDAPLARAIYDAAARQAHERGAFELRPGIAVLFTSLHERGLLLGLAANQPAAALARLDAAGVGCFFTHREVSGVHGYAKPDVRLFLRACEQLGVAPDACIMVGDRVDNDIAPARLLGMRTVLFRTGRHATQQPRSWDELPDAEVHSVDELCAALDALLHAGAGSP
jgi:putative hydrolase of the HAD superfamily